MNSRDLFEQLKFLFDSILFICVDNIVMEVINSTWQNLIQFQFILILSLI